MRRNLSVERLYNLGDYKNIKFINTLEDVPEELVDTPEKVNHFYQELYLECEIGYRSYVDMVERMNKQVTTTVAGKKVADPDEVREFLAEERKKLLEENYQPSDEGDK